MENQNSMALVHGSGDKLCESCVKLPLTEEDIKRFEEDIEQAQSKVVFFERGIPGNIYIGAFNIGTLSEIRLRVKCPMCRLFMAAFDNDPQRERHEKDIHKPIILSWEAKRKGFCSLKGLVSLGTRLAFVRENDGSAFGHGRRIQTKQIDTELISSWLRRCQNEHGSQCGPQGKSGIDSTSPAVKLPLRLIDVHRRCLIEVEGPSKYVALSYVWGKVKTLRLLKKNRISLMEPFALDSLCNKIPRTILDAMDLVGRLGLLYLWVDALCIAQDDENELAQEIQRMDLIYKNSICTIIAADGVDADAGLSGVQPNSRQVHQVLERVTADKSLVALYELDDFLRTPIYSTRGWTFQERIFSPRNVVFINGQVFFQCQLRIWSEDTCYEAEPSNATADKPYGSLVAMALSQDIFPYQSFQTLVKYYSERQLSYDSDALNAAAGLLRMLSGRLGSTMFQGLPRHGLDAYLLFFIRSGKSEQKRNAHFPSYSWAGWKGPVQWFQHASFHISSPFNEPVAWTRESAWIRWFKLRPNGLACSISNLPEIVSESSHLQSAARTRLKTEIPSIRRDVEQAVLKIKDPKLEHRYQYPLLIFMTVSVFFKVCVNAGHEYRETLFVELSDRDSDFCGYIWYDHSAPEISKAHSEFILLSETNYGRKESSIPLETEVQQDDLQAQSDGEEALSIHSGDEYTRNQMPWSEICGPGPDLLDQGIAPWTQATEPWDYYWVLLIEWDNGVAERRGIGKIFKIAAEKSFPPGPVWKQINLA